MKTPARGKRAVTRAFTFFTNCFGIFQRDGGGSTGFGMFQLFTGFFR
jgi:hypothetical protein